MKILNLYAGIGGNRKLWGDEHEITAVENVPEIAKIYQDFFPKDKVIIGDAHQYLLDHFKEFDFIWSSPPCTTHSRNNIPHFAKGRYRFADMKLYQEIILLKSCFKGKWAVENVISYYPPLIKPKRLGRHYYWSNFYLGNLMENINDDITLDKLEKGKEYHSINLEGYNINQRMIGYLLRNCVNPKHGLHIFNMAFKEKQVTL